MTITLTITIPVLVALLGLVYIYRRRNTHKTRSAWTNQYLETFRNLFTNPNTPATMNKEHYEWLTRNGPLMQAYLGRQGFFQYGRGAGAPVSKNFRIITDTMFRIGAKQHDLVLLQLTDDALIQYLGVLDLRISAVTRALKNPLIWLREGVRLIVQSPIRFLGDIGLLNKRTTEKITQSAFLRVLSRFFILLGVLATIITITIGWTKFLTIVKGWF